MVSRPPGSPLLSSPSNKAFLGFDSLLQRLTDSVQHCKLLLLYYIKDAIKDTDEQKRRHTVQGLGEPQNTMVRSWVLLFMNSTSSDECDCGYFSQIHGTDEVLEPKHHYIGLLSLWIWDTAFAITWMHSPTWKVVNSIVGVLCSSSSSPGSLPRG